MSKPGTWGCIGSRRIAAGLRCIVALPVVLPLAPLAPVAVIAPALAVVVSSIACPRASAGAAVDTARFEEARPRVVAWLSRADAAVGEEVLMTIEVIGPVSVDVSLDDPEPVHGLLFRAASGPVPAIRTDATANGVVTRNYVATFTVPIRVLSGGRYEITPPAVIDPDESAWTHPPLILDARGPSPGAGREEPRFEVGGPEAPVFAGERVSIRVRVSVDDAVCPMEARTFTFPWWDQVVALDPSVQAGGDAKWATVLGADYRVQLSAGSSDASGKRVYSGSFDVVPVRAGALSLDGSRFSAVAAGTWSSTGTPGASTVSASSSGGSIVVVPLPSAGRPPGFVDLVGDFDVQASIDRDALLVGEAFTLTLDVRERGAATNLAFARIIDPPQWPGFRPQGEPRYETEKGRCQVRFVFAPEDVATAAPALDVSWFQPAARSYQTRTLGPFPLTATARPNAGPDRDETADRPLAGAIMRALRYGWIGVGVLLAVLFVRWFVRSPRASASRRESSSDPGVEPVNASATGSTVAQDRQRARARFDEARRAASAAGFDTLAASRALARYIGDCSGVSPAACFGEEAGARLRVLGVPPEVAAHAVRHFRAAERRAFGDAVTTGGGADERDWDDASRIVARVDAAID